MKKAVVIGGRGKVGSYLVPMLVRGGYEVVSVSRGRQQAPCVPDEAWNSVRHVTLDREQAGFEAEIKKLRGDVVIDMICFQSADMQRLVDALRGDVSHYLATGSVWAHGFLSMVPALEEECREPLEDYGIQKSLMEQIAVREYAERKFPGTIVHPGHIVCPGDPPVNPQGNKNMKVFEILRAGEPLYMANFGAETVHHVHAADVAGVYWAAIQAGQASFGEGFHAVSPRAVTLRGYAGEAAGWFGKKADLRFEPFEAWQKRVSQDDRDATLTHMEHSPSSSMEKAKRLLGFTPKYTSYQAVKECVASFGQFAELRGK